jgi:hypothetical protein
MNKKLTLWLRAASLVFILGMLTPSANAFQTELGIGYPVGTGNKNLTPNLDLNITAYFDRFIDPAIDNFLSVGYDSFSLLADSGASFRVFPVLVGIELPGKVFSDLNVTLGVGVGAAFGYIASQHDFHERDCLFRCTSSSGTRMEIKRQFLSLRKSPDQLHDRKRFLHLRDLRFWREI